MTIPNNSRPSLRPFPIRWEREDAFQRRLEIEPMNRSSRSQRGLSPGEPPSGSVVDRES